MASTPDWMLVIALTGALIGGLYVGLPTWMIAIMIAGSVIGYGIMGSSGSSGSRGSTSSGGLVSSLLSKLSGSDSSSGRSRGRRSGSSSGGFFSNLASGVAGALGSSGGTPSNSQGSRGRSRGERDRGGRNTGRQGSGRGNNNTNLNRGSTFGNMGDRLDQAKGKVGGLFGDDEEVEEKALTDMGQLAETIQGEMGDLEKEEKMDKQILDDIKTLSQDMHRLMDHESELREILAQGVTLGNMEETAPKIRKLANQIIEDEEELEEEFERIQDEIGQQEKEGKKISKEEDKIAKLESQVAAEFDRHQQMVQQAERALNSEVNLSDNPYSNQ